MGRDEGRGAYYFEVVFLEGVGQLRQGVVKASVSKGHKGYGGGSVSREVVLDEGEQLVGELPCVGWAGKDDEVFRRVGIVQRSAFGQSEVQVRCIQ